MDLLDEAVFERLAGEADDSVLRKYQDAAARIVGDLFQQQADMVLDPAPYKAALCSRRAGKSTGACAAVHRIMCMKPGANVLYVHITRTKAKEEIWPALKRMAVEYELCDEEGFNESDLTIEYNGGKCILKGADKMGDVGKLRGSDGGYDLVIVDESGYHGPILFKFLIRDILGPTLTDRPGAQLLIIGTPGNVLLGEFYDATGPKADVVAMGDDGVLRAPAIPYVRREEPYYKGAVSKWSSHKWQTSDNVKKPWIWQKMLETKRAEGISDDDIIWRREYRAEWVLSGDGFVSAYHPEKNACSPAPGATNAFGLPGNHEWRYVLGIDPGFTHATAMVVWAYAKTSKDFYAIEEFELSGMDVNQVADTVRDLDLKYGGFSDIIGDPAAPVYWHGLATRHKLHVRLAQKKGKLEHIELWNADFRAGNCWVRKGMKLGEQMLQLKLTLDRKDVDDSTPDDLFDAALYAWFYCYSNYAKRPWRDMKAEMADPNWRRNKLAEEQARTERLAAVERQRQIKNGPSVYGQDPARSSVYGDD